MKPRIKPKFLYKLFILLLINVLIITMIYSETSAYSSIGAQGEEVRQIQTKLTELGFFSDTVDGIFGEKTKAALISFQNSNGLAADGIAGPDTLSALGIGGDSSSQTGGQGYGGFSESDFQLLARVISAEARGEPFEGQVAVGAVIMNRIDHPSFPNTLSGVIYQPQAFSCLYDGGIDAPTADSAYQAAREAINGSDPSGGAIYYYNPEKATSEWIFSRETISIIGSHTFAI